MRTLLSNFLVAALCVTGVPALWADTSAAEDKASGHTAFMGEQNDKSDEVQVLEAKDIAALDDQKIVDAYIDVLVELEASRVFHSTSGFTPKEYRKYKNLLKYRMQLLLEIHRRKIEIPPEIK